ncbi:MAG: hypothetical protein O2887_14265 [Bacteroidetes bacterium]|nr:hypothetical protein [Bacteroidota bacterium]MDA1121634.1 hypothetical protein [Bacteroidota bacterium]
MLLSSNGIAQILDDTTKLIYGAFSTKFFYKDAIKFDTGKEFDLDTTLTNVHLFEWSEKYNHEYQGLGNLGTALTPTFFQFPDVVGLTAGYNAYNLYATDPSRIKYFETRSPFIEFNLLLGGQGRSMGSFDYSRNIRERWNVGFNFRKLEADKQIGAQSLRGDKNVREIAYDIYMSYESENKKYSAMGYLSRFSHSVLETGGIRVTSEDPAELFGYRDAAIYLRNAKSKDFRVDYHIYHQYRLTPYTQLYHSFRRNARQNIFRDYKLASNNTGFYPTPLISQDSTQDVSNFTYLENEVGMKGKIGPFFYLGYLKRRDINHFYRYYKPFQKTSETYIGFNGRFDFSEKIKLGGDGEFLQNGNFKANAFIETPILEGGYHAARYEPSILQKAFLGNHAEWHNSFNPTFAFELYGNLKYENQFISLKSGLSFNTIDNYIYFNENKTPDQDGNPANITTIKLDLKMNLPLHLHFKANSRFTNVGGQASDLFRIPKIFATGGIYYDNFWFNSYMQVRIGVDGYFRTAHYANAYDPITQQFFLQNDFELDTYVVADAYFNAKIQSLIIFLKYNHVNQAFNNGYLTTPFYTGLPRTFDIGFRWRWYD